MTLLEEYTIFVNSKCKELPDKEHYQHMALGLAGEVGEVVELVKKECFYGKEWKYDDMKHELGDVLFYLVALAHANGCSMDDIIRSNIKKLNKRYSEGFTSEEAIKRSDV